MNVFAQSIFQDLRERRLLPIAGLLVLVLVALPFVLLKKSSPAPAVAPAAGSVAAPASASGLPSPQEALSTDKPLVSLAVLEDPSSLSTYRRRNPFKPLEGLTADAGTGSAGGANVTSDVSKAQSAANAGGGSSGGGSSPSSGGDQKTSTTPTPTPAPTTTTPKSDTPKDGTSKPEKLTYALDLTFTGPNGGRSYRSVAKLRMLPSETQPLFVYLGVDTTGTKAVFLVDSTLTFTGGEGACSPDRTSCATVSMQPGEIATFKNAQNETFELEIDQIRTVSAKDAAASARKADRSARARARARAQATAADGIPRRQPRRFMPPVITDLFTGASR